jgi:hypothetical protein
MSSPDDVVMEGTGRLQFICPGCRSGARLADQIEEAEPRRRLYRNMGRAAAKLMESKPPGREATTVAQ